MAQQPGNPANNRDGYAQYLRGLAESTAPREPLSATVFATYLRKLDQLCISAVERDLAADERRLMEELSELLLQSGHIANNPDCELDVELAIDALMDADPLPDDLFPESVGADASFAEGEQALSTAKRRRELWQGHKRRKKSR